MIAKTAPRHWDWLTEIHSSTPIPSNFGYLKSTGRFRIRMIIDRAAKSLVVSIPFDDRKTTKFLGSIITSPL
jgi:hypothetical protein